MVSSQRLDVWKIKMILFSSPAILFSVSNEILLSQDCFTDVSAVRQDQQLPQQSETNFHWNFLTCIYFNLPFLLLVVANFSLKIVPSDFTTDIVQLGVSILSIFS